MGSPSEKNGLRDSRAVCCETSSKIMILAPQETGRIGSRLAEGELRITILAPEEPGRRDLGLLLARSLTIQTTTHGSG